MLLKFKLDKDGFRFTNPADLIAARSIDYIKCHFDIEDSTWANTDAIVAVFKSATYNKHAETLLDSNNSCFIDPSVYKNGGTIQVKLIGDKYQNEEVISSTTVTSILEFTINENVIIPVTTPSMYAIVIAELEKSKAAVDQVLTDIAYKLAHGELTGVGIQDVVYNLDGTVTVTLTDSTTFTSSFSLKGEKGDSGVYYGSEEPTDPEIDVWIDPDGEATMEPIYPLIEKWFDEHPEATTTVQDGSLTEAKFAVSVKKKLKYTYIEDEVVTLKDGYYIYDNCVINDIADESVLAGDHIFNNCTIGTLFIKGGTYRFHNCTFDYIRVGNTTAKFYGCTGHSIHLNGACHNSVINGCKLTASSYAPIKLNGSVAENVYIGNNEVINNQSASLTGIEQQCINTHGVANSIIENNTCIVDTVRIAIDISGDGTSIRSYNNIVRNNTSENGTIALYATKDVKCIGNNVNSITLEGAFLTDDYGTWLISENVLQATINFRVNSGDPTLKIIISNNLLLGGRGINTNYDFDETKVFIYLINNAIKGSAVQPTAKGKKVILARKQIYVLAGQTVVFPPCYVHSSELGSYGLTADTFYETMTAITNGDNVNRYAVISQIGDASSSVLWNQ